MDFQAASDRMISAFTPQEKKLASQYAQSHFLDAETRTV